MSLPVISEAPKELQSIRDWIRWASTMFARAELFFGHGTDNEWDEAAVLILWAIAQPWERLETIYDCHITEDESAVIRYLVNERIQLKVPSAYLTGEAYFAGLKFFVNPSVLVPRSPIAELILNGFEPWLVQYPTLILDMCTGSGCIGIAAAHMFEESEVDCVDISSDALDVARRNIALYKLEDRVKAIESDGFAQLDSQQYDLIMSNPPYVDIADIASMPAEFHAEPEIGLGSGRDGLDFTRHLLKESAKRLKPNGILVGEVGNSWPALEEAFPELCFFWPELENGGHGVFVLTQEQLTNAFGSDEPSTSIV